MSNKYFEIGYTSQDFYVKSLNLLAEDKNVPDDIFKLASFKKPVASYRVYTKVEINCSGVAHYNIAHSKDVPTGNYTVKRLPNGNEQHIAETNKEYTYRDAQKEFNITMPLVFSLDEMEESASISEINAAYKDSTSKKERIQANDKLKSVTSSIVKESFINDLKKTLDTRELNSESAKAFGSRLSIDQLKDRILLLTDAELKVSLSSGVSLGSNESINNIRLDSSHNIISTTYYIVSCYEMEYTYKDTTYSIKQTPETPKITLGAIPKNDGWAENNPKKNAFLHKSVLAPLIGGSVFLLLFILFDTLQIGGEILAGILAVPTVGLFAVSGVFFYKRLKVARTAVSETKSQDLKRHLENLNELF